MDLKTLTEFLNTSTDLFYSRNLVTNKYEFISNSVLDIIGFTPDEFVNMSVKNVINLIHPDDREKITNIVIQFVSDHDLNARCSLEYRIKHKNGHYLWVNENISKIVNEYNEPTHMVGNLRNVTKQKNTELKLNHQNALLDAIIHNTSGSLWSVNRDFELIQFNPKFRDDIKKAFNKDVEMGMNVLDGVSDLEYKEWKRYYERAISGESFVFERRRKYGDANSWYEYHFSPVKLKTGNIDGATVQAYDITERKQAEKTIIESEARFKQYTRSSPVGIYTTDLNGDCNFANTRWLDMAGMTFEEAKGKGWINGLHPDDRESISRKWYKAVKSDGKWGFEYRFMNKKRKITWVYGMAVKIEDIEGKTIGYLGTNININEIKKAQEKLQQTNQRLEELNATKDKLFSVIAHDLKSPFSSILGFSELLVKHIETKQYDKIEKFGYIIFNESKNSFALLNNLLDWSRTQTGGILFEPSNFNLHDLIKDVITLLEVTANQKQITIVYATKDKHGLFADKNMIYTLIRNMISNAIKFTQPGGKIIISVKKQKKLSRITIKDTGIGISEEKIKSLFKLDGSHSSLGTNNEKGTGLGLILCKDFIDKHKGKINVESEPGKGSTFIVEIPQ